MYSEMKVIADTNVWYNMGQNTAIYNKVKDLPITPTYLTIYELSTSEKVTSNEDSVRTAIQMLFRFQQYLIIEPPFTHISKLSSTCDFSETEKENIKNLLEFTTRFANGYSYKDDSIRRTYIGNIKKSLEKGADLINDEAIKIRHRIKDKKNHERGRTNEIINYFLRFCVKATTGNRCIISESFDFGKVELFVKTLGLFFKKLETSPQKFSRNDWADIAFLAYVQPGDKYWTFEKK